MGKEEEYQFTQIFLHSKNACGYIKESQITSNHFANTVQYKTSE
jgi:hypothetical protein